MAARDRRGARTGRKTRPRTIEPRRPAPAPVYSHPWFGSIPIITRTSTDADGQVRTWTELDPDYRPPLPAGAVRGEPRRQRGRGAFDVPRYFYVDAPRRCVQCRAEFVFTASEQKHWYETLGFNFASVAIRCPRCRRRRRSDKALHHGVDDAKRALVERPADPTVHLALAEAIIALHERTGRGQLDEAIAAARAARRLARDQPPRSVALTHYWEARAQAAAGREGAARSAFAGFLAEAGARAHRREIAVAQAWLAAAGEPE